MWHVSNPLSKPETIALRDVPIGAIAIHPSSNNTYFRASVDVLLAFFDTNREQKVLTLSECPTCKSYVLAPKGTRIELTQE